MDDLFEDTGFIPDEWIRQSELARRIGRVRQYVNTLVKKGVLQAREDRRVNYPDALRALELSKDPARDPQRDYQALKRSGTLGDVVDPGRTASGQVPSPGKGPDAEEILFSKEIPTDPTKLSIEARRARLIRERKEAQLKDLDLKARRGELISLEDVQEQIERVAVTVRAKLLTLPGKCACLVEGKTAHDAREILEDAVNEALEDLHRLGGPVGD